MKHNINEKYKRFVELLDFSNGKYSKVDVFRDFLMLFAIAIKNKFYFEQEDEDMYLRTTKKYKKDELKVFPKLINELFKIYYENEKIEDALGEISSQIGGLSIANQQFFTPNNVAEMMGKLLIKNQEIKNYITINDPACGSGSLLLGAINNINNNEIDYSEKVLVVAQDIDLFCFCMTYIQLSIYSVPGVVILGNTLDSENRKVFYTPQYIVGEWHKRKK